MANEGGSLSAGFTYSIYFMLGVVMLLIPALYGGLLWNTYRGQRARAKQGKVYTPSSGAVRWVDEEVSSSDESEGGDETTDH